ncbi:AhpC/TSA family protein [Aquimarina sp. D1M17]|uniref:TlpA disulfide reductase family protein n=1 Tax=Aquimarina acroporae TaxID=2937283 RepID=UPI0020BED340|nr:TlpA disulfide reductase family protein [Aquimarina acroporae]MCK8524014.1 AhpC/TSA family protein [Aquimarina acroporae]
MTIKAFTHLLIFIFVFSIFSCKQENKEQQNNESSSLTSGYKVEVTMKNTPDSTWVFYGTTKSKDSLMVMNEKLEFEGKIEEPQFIFIHTKDYNNGVTYLWLENQNITVSIENSNLYTAKVAGGKSQEEFEILADKKKVLEKEYMEVIKPLQTNSGTEKYLDSLSLRSKEILDELGSIEKNFIKDYPDSYVSAQTLSLMGTTWDKQEVSKLYEGLSDNMKNSSYGLSVKEYLAIPKKPKIGSKYVDFELPDTNGKSIKLSEVEGKYILVEFWASWCGPCRKENPNLIKTYNQFKDKGFEILGVSLDGKKDKWTKAIETDKLPWTQVSDLKVVNSYPALVYSVNVIPYNFLIDQQGIIIAENLRGPELDHKLNELFN